MARDPSGPVGSELKSPEGAFSIRAIGEVVGELRRVTWPSKEETLRLTLMVIAVSAVIGAFLGAVDIGFARLMGILLGN